MIENLNNEENEEKEIKTKDRTLKEKSFVMDINIIEAPLFSFNNRKSVTTVESLSKTKGISKELAYILNKVPEGARQSQVEFRSWVDSKGMEREILAMSMFNLPDSFAMDVFYAAIGLYVKKHSPITFNNEDGIYNLTSNQVEFTIYEMCEYMGLSVGGKSYQRIKDALRELNAVDYYSLAKGVFYNKKKEKYETSREESISLIDHYSFIGRENRSKDDRCTITLGNLVIENLKYSFIRFLSNNTYFQLKTGLTRRLYSYIEGNKYNKKYIKRSYNTLKHKIPVDYKYPSILKRRINTPLENLIKVGMIKDYFYGDEILINGVKEDCIYIIFEGTKKQLIDSLTVKQVDLKEEKKTELKIDYKMEFPTDIEKELKEFKISENKIFEIINKYDRWKIAEYILWLKDGIKKGKVKDPAGLFVFAITAGMVDVASTNPEIIEFVQKYRKEVEGKKEVDEALIKKEYHKYIEKELKLFEKEDEFAFYASRDTVLKDIENSQKKKIKAQRQLYNMAEPQAEKDKLLAVIEKWEEFSVKKEKSEIFIELFVKKVKLYRGLKDFNEFRNSYIEKNS